MPKRRTVTKAQGGIIAALFTVLLLICGAFAALAGFDVGGISDTETPVVDAPPTLPPLFPSDTPFAPDPNSPTSTPFIIGAPEVPLAGGWWDVYFTDPVKHRDPNVVTGSVEEKLIQFINTAQTSIHIASFEFDLDATAQAVIAAHNRGVDVRWVTDDENGLIADEEPGHGQFKMLHAGVQ
ncbi:MAG: hypothetical protein HGA79_10915 [Anaerolineales bacterium]|nr:hypothetical protein [Anaerolineales bacterium]